MSCTDDVSGEGVPAFSYLENPRCRDVPGHRTTLPPAPATSPHGDRPQERESEEEEEESGAEEPQPSRVIIRALS